jgi:hypothetical protein
MGVALLIVVRRVYVDASDSAGKPWAEDLDDGEVVSVNERVPRVFGPPGGAWLEDEAARPGELIDDIRS